VVSADAAATIAERRLGDEKGCVMKKILVATDGSEATRAAVDAGLDLAADEGGEVVFVRVAPLFEFSNGGNGGDRLPQRIARVEEDPTLREACARAAEHGITAQAELLIGYAAKQILLLAREIDADVIVIGSRGLGPVKSAVVGSTSRDILAHADRPVLVIRETGARELVQR
jgi:nucleotide-binding universal stress UspA family protein